MVTYIAADGLSIKLGTCCSVAMVGIDPVIQTIAVCYLALVARKLSSRSRLLDWGGFFRLSLIFS